MGADTSDRPAPEPFSDAMRKRSKGLGTLRHPVWGSIATVITAATVGLTVWQVGFTGDKPAVLEVANVSLGETQPIDSFVWESYAPNEKKSSSSTVTPIDVSIKNNGDAPLKINKIEAAVHFATVVDCTRQGGGMMSSASYSVILPQTKFQPMLSVADKVPADIPEELVTVTADFTVEPKSTGRFDLTVGSSEQFKEDPAVISVTLELVSDTGLTAPLGTFALVPPNRAEKGIETIHWMQRSSGRSSPYVAKCTGVYAELMKQGSARADYVSRAYTEFEKALEAASVNT